MAGLDDLLNPFIGTAKPGPYTTPLTLTEEMNFQDWAKQNKVPITPDYDMRGYWKALQKGEVRFTPGGHFPDTWKTPEHQSFSNESIYATGKAPHWEGGNLLDQLRTVLFKD